MNWALTLTEEYRASGDKVRLYGIVLYTEEHAHVLKVLRDPIYWRAIDEVSGPHWVIFSVRPVEGKYELPSIPPGMLGELVAVWKEPSENKALLEEFQLPSTEKLPVLLVFTQNDNGDILKTSLSIDDKSVETAFYSLKKGVSLVTSVVEGIVPENRAYAEGVFRAAEARIDAHKQWETVKKGVNIVAWIRSLLP